jgi:GNAT superfamily N-acetyltransferase
MDVVIRPAVPEEASSLRALARASKAYWGYSQAYMQEWDYDAEIASSFVSAHDVFLAEARGRLAGFYALSRERPVSHLKHLWIEPEFIRRGVGTALLGHAIGQASSGEGSIMVVHADPNAVGFYERMGARRVGGIPEPRLDQVFPVLELQVGGGLTRRCS